jgi:hypothetical protein
MSEAAGSSATGIISQLSHTLLDMLGELPTTSEPAAHAPLIRAKQIAGSASLRAAATSGGLALPPGPLGMLTTIPDLVVIWRIQSQMVADIAGTFGKGATLTREQMLYCLFRHAASLAVRDLVVRAGERFIVRRVSSGVIEAILRKLGVRITERLAGEAASRWLPVVGAIGVGAYAWYDTAHVGKTAIDLFRREVVIDTDTSPPDETERA